MRRVSAPRGLPQVDSAVEELGSFPKAPPTEPNNSATESTKSTAPIAEAKASAPDGSQPSVAIQTAPPLEPPTSPVPPPVATVRQAGRPRGPVKEKKHFSLLPRTLAVIEETYRTGRHPTSGARFESESEVLDVLMTLPISFLQRPANGE